MNFIKKIIIINSILNKIIRNTKHYKIYNNEKFEKIQ